MEEAAVAHKIHLRDSASMRERIISASVMKIETPGLPDFHGFRREACLPTFAIL
jgi:hypothetical protein